MAYVGWVLLGLLSVYEWVLIARAILSWVEVINPRWTPRGIVLVLAEAVFTLTDPPLRALRKVIKPLRLGNMALDMAFLVLFVLVIVLMRAIQWVFV
jgi:YggT family protein